MIYDYVPCADERPMISIVPALSDAESTVPGNGKANAGMTGARILVVDDEKPTADMLATYLEAVGYNTSAVYTAKEGAQFPQEGTL